MNHRILEWWEVWALARQAQNKFSSSFFSSWEKNCCPRAPGEAGKGNLTFRALELRRRVGKAVCNMEIRPAACFCFLGPVLFWVQTGPWSQCGPSPLWDLRAMPVNGWPAFLSARGFSASVSSGHILYPVNSLVLAFQKGCVGLVSVPLRRGGGHRLPPGPGMKVNWKCQALSRVWLFATPWTVAHQAPLSMEFSRQEYRSGYLLPSLGHLPDPGIEPRSAALQADSSPSEPPGRLWFQKVDELLGCVTGIRIPSRSDFGNKVWLCFSGICSEGMSVITKGASRGKGWPPPACEGGTHLSVDISVTMRKKWSSNFLLKVNDNYNDSNNINNNNYN